MAKARKKAVKKYTLSEFKAWLEGIEEIQPDDWSPDLGQWKMIRDKIAAIQEPPPPVETGIVIPPAPARPPPRQVQQAPAQLPPSSLTTNTVTGDIPTPEMTPAAKAILSGKLPKEMVTDPSGTSKTPNIDTLDGNYESSFT